MKTVAYSVNPDQKLALRINEATAICGLSRSTLYKLVSEDKLRAIKIGGRRLIMRDDLLALLNSGSK